MAATNSAPRKKFDLANPGGKEYLIAGGVVLGLALIYFYIKKQQAAAATTAADTTGTGDTTGAATPTGLSTGQLLAWIQDHSSSTTTTTTGGGGGTTGGSKTPDYWQTATDLLKKGGNTNPTHAQIEAEYRKITPAAVRKREEAFNKAHGKK